MDNMFGKNDDFNNLKDTHSSPLGIVIKDTPNPIAYTKTNKLITALYMVTDIMDKDEPIRLKLRTLGADILSDMYTSPVKAIPKIKETLAFLDIAGMVNAISEMNAGILRKEFSELKQAIFDSNQPSATLHSELDLSEIFDEGFSLPSASFMTEKREVEDRVRSNSIGVQKGSTLLKALKNINVSDRKNNVSDKGQTLRPDFEFLKRQRKNDILAIIKSNPQGVTITDIKTKATGSLATCGEKTLQRELIGMLKDNLLKKTGEKRWSRYFLA